jgi:hypothetical protein
MGSDDPIHRQQLVDSGHLFFMRDSQRTDLLDGSKTQDGLIEFLAHMVGLGYHIEFTAINTDHGYDGNLGPHCHNPCGCAVDCWPLMSPTPGAWLDAGDPIFRQFLRDAKAAPNYGETGLAGSAYTPANVEAAGPNVFQDDVEDHIHFQIA